MHIFEPGLWHDAALVEAPVVTEFGQGSVEPGIVAGDGSPEPGVAAGVDLAKAMDQREGPGPWSLVHRAVDAELGEIDCRRLQRQRNVDRGAALINRNAKIDAGRHPRADPRNATPDVATIADKIALRAGPGRNAVHL